MALSPTDRTRQIDARLKTFYGARRWTSSGDPVGELVATILSQNTSDVNSMRAYASLKRAFPTWKSVVEAPAEDVAEAIRSGGLANIKAPRIQRVLGSILADFPDGNLDELTLLDVNVARVRLTSLPGVGMKTASCVLLFSLGMPAMPVDTHVHRVAERTGTIPAKTSADRAHAILESQLDGSRDSAYAFHLNCITLGREICRARTPRCEMCPISDLCHYYASHHRV